MKYKFYEPEVFMNNAEKAEHKWRDTKDRTFEIGVKRITLPANVYSYLEQGERLLVTVGTRLIERDRPGYNRNRNIWCYNAQGEKIWEIEDRLLSMKCEGYEVDPYVGIKDYGDRVLVRTYGQFIGELDIETGKVSNWRWER